MLNIESIDKTNEGNYEISFSDENADMVLKIIMSKNSSKELIKMLGDKLK